MSAKTTKKRARVLETSEIPREPESRTSAVVATNSTAHRDTPAATLAIDSRERFQAAHERSAQALEQYLMVVLWWQTNRANNMLAAATVAASRSPAIK